MFRRYVALATLLPALALFAACESNDNSPSTTSTATLLASVSSQRVRPVLLVGDPAAGTVTLALNVSINNHNVITAATGTFTGNFTGFPQVSSLTAAHVNQGADGTNGPVVINLNLQTGQVTFPDGTGSLSVTVPVDPSVATEMLANPGNYYFQGDTALFPNGAIRGQFATVVAVQR